MRHMTELMNKIDVVLQNVTINSVQQLVDQLIDYKEHAIFRARLRRENKLTPEIEQVLNQGI